MIQINKAFMVLLFTLLVFSFQAKAKQKQQPVYIESDYLRVDEKKGLSYFDGHVKFKQGDLIIHADNVKTKSSDGQLNSIILKGKPVKMNQNSKGQEPISATANRIEYFTDTEIIHLYGNALFQQGQQQFRGQHIQYNSVKQQIIANGDSQTIRSDGQGRVKAVIMPRTKTQSNNK